MACYWCLLYMRYKRRLYIPGIISAIGFLLFIQYNKEQFTKTPTRALSFSVPRLNHEDEYPGSIFSNEYLENLIKKKRQIRIYLDSNQTKNYKKIELIRHEARKLKYTYDTNTVINISLSPNLNYKEFISLVDLCYTDEHKRFAIVNQSLVIFGEPPPTPVLEQRQSNLMCLLCNDVIYLPSPAQKKSFLNKIYDKIKPFSFFQISILTALWLFMIICSLFQKRNNS